MTMGRPFAVIVARPSRSELPSATTIRSGPPGLGAEHRCWRPGRMTLARCSSLAGNPGERPGFNRKFYLIYAADFLGRTTPGFGVDDRGIASMCRSRTTCALIAAMWMQCRSGRRRARHDPTGRPPRLGPATRRPARPRTPPARGVGCPRSSFRGANAVSFGHLPLGRCFDLAVRRPGSALGNLF